ncbi:MAG: exodeoxyribonuclease VII small subunit [Puniceicoccaceae bacterium]|nr:MAG: exodeoxyribonuclease VII small subunit [Puniceicoccaceae bacterium]
MVSPVPASSDPPSEPTFEQALARLEALIAALEEGSVPLSELIEKFEEGTKLLKVCELHLNQAEQKILQLKATDAGASLEDFDPDRE